ncbi:hypothetical protein WG66_010493 [Moniliophthora roreri]|nr:hypothetical protein WG66_010493 [Moniliophthora roreri]
MSSCSRGHSKALLERYKFRMKWRNLILLMPYMADIDKSLEAQPLILHNIWDIRSLRSRNRFEEVVRPNIVKQACALAERARSTSYPRYALDLLLTVPYLPYLYVQ